ncbi:hypothetical protein Pint_13733 [Pistacia integerrima]|uniref:Uncharacterized protein n=1 Tax=Pistacia integerrima TaxID=434235 RepID=A0ACC0Y844_9ROSI|nr:hypothetical protein Pint_13733 [Pistacia integerrima]
MEIERSLPLLLSTAQTEHDQHVYCKTRKSVFRLNNVPFVAQSRYYHKMGSYDSGSGSKDDRDEDDDEEYEEYEDISGGNRLLGFMFGNVDNSGDLDIDYLDEDAKEQLAAVADKLGPSLTDIDLSVNSPQGPADPADQGAHYPLEMSKANIKTPGLNMNPESKRKLVMVVKFLGTSECMLYAHVGYEVSVGHGAFCNSYMWRDVQCAQRILCLQFYMSDYFWAGEMDYDQKAEDAVDYEDIDEQYEGPETQAVSEEDHLLPQKEYFSAEVSLATLKPTTSLFDDENYDEDDEFENEQELVDQETKVSIISLSGEQDACVTAVPEGEKSLEDDLQVGSLGTEEDMVVGVEDHDEELADILEGALDGQDSALLPVLCVEEGLVILRFSEIFGIHEPLKKREKREQRYSIHKDRYNALDISDLVEEDEEVYLKGSSQGSFVKDAHVVQHDTSLNDDDSELANFGFVQDATPTSGQYDELRKVSYFSAEPMKEDLNLNLPAGWQSTLSPNFFPLDQHDWEEDILWDSSPSASENSFKSAEITGTDLETALIGDSELEPRQCSLHSELSVKDEKDHSTVLHNSHVLLEPFGSRNSSDHINNSFVESRCHPQILRLESQLDLDNINHGDGRRENCSSELCQFDALKRFSELALQNRDMMDGSWLDNIMWEPLDAVEKPKLILDLQDEQMLFEILDNKDNKHLELHAGAMIVTRSVKSSSLDSFELSGHKYQCDWKFNIANDKFYMNGKISQQLQTNSNKRIPHGIRVHHSAPALKLQTMKLKLSK